jgi:heterodisulfide reductase subunit B
MRYAYYPGCSLERSAWSYAASTKAIAEALGLELVEVQDWNCCGASEYFSLNKTAAYALVARNLALAAGQDGFTQLVAPCSMCYLNLRKTDHYMGKYPKLGETTNAALAAGGLSYKPGSLEVRHLLDAVVNDVGLEAIQAKVVQPLAGLRAACYYGCLVVRPDFDGKSFDNPEYPVQLDQLMKALGAEVVDFPLKAHCCGGHMTQISSDTAFELIRRLLHNAAEYQADVIVTVCPMCQLNLDAYQPQVNRHFKTDYHIPVLYFTQLLGLALGLPAEDLGIGSEFVSSDEALAKIGAAAEAEPAGAPARRKRDDKALPMPGQRGEQ